MIDIDNILYTGADLHDTDASETIGNTRIAIFQALGGKRNQEDVVFLAGAAPRPSNGIAAFLKRTIDETAAQITNEEAGSTATVAYLSTDGTLTLAHLGDSPALLFVRNQHTGKVKAHLLIRPHTLDDPAERARVEREGGRIVDYGPGGPVRYRIKRYDKKSNDPFGIAPPRGFGDKAYPGITAQADITSVRLSDYAQPGDRVFLCVCTDGLFSGLTTVHRNDYAEIIHQTLKAGRQQDIPHLMADYAFQRVANAGLKARADNMSILFAELPKERTHDIVLGVCDGHGGNKAARMAGRLLVKKLGEPDLCHIKSGEGFVAGYEQSKTSGPSDGKNR